MSLTEMKITRDAVALEAGVVQNVEELIKSIFPTVRETVTNFINVFTPDQQAIVLTGKQRDFIREAEKHKYSDLEALGAYVPEGLNSNYKEYLADLSKLVSHTAINLNEILCDFATFLAALVTNKDALMSSSTFESKLLRLEKERSELNKEIGKHFKNGSTKTDVTWGAVIARISDWNPVFTLSEGMLKEINSVDRKLMNKKILEIKDLIDVVQKKMQRGELENASPAVAQNLADCTYAVASELEFFSVVYYKVAAVTTAMNRTVDHFNKIFEV